MKNLLRKMSFKGKERLIRLFNRPGGKSVIERVVSSNGSLMHIRTDDVMGWQVYWHGGYENDTTWVLNYFLNKDSVCVDIGANIGVYTLPMARIAKEVVSVEPHPVFLKQLKLNLQLNRIQNVTTKQLAIFDEKKEVTLFSPGEDNPNKTASLYSNELLRPEKVKVQAITLDELAGDLPRLDFVKIDTDGSDPKVILSGKNAIKKHRPHILFEYSIDNTALLDGRAMYEKSASFLLSEGYRLYEIKKGYLEPLDEYGDFMNILAVPT